MAGKWRKVRTNAELAKALADGDYGEIVGAGYFEVGDSATVSAYGSATVRAYGSATVRASGSATVRASGSATVSASGSATVRAYDSATVRAYDSATVSAYGSATVRASGSATVRASGFVAVHRLSMHGTINGGVIITPPNLTDTAGWLDYYGIKASRGYVTLYKGVRGDWTSDHGANYKPGSKPVAADWNPRNECGGGLHFSPHAHLTHIYCTPTRYVAVKVKVADLVPIGDEGSSDKCKAKSCTVLYECDVDGNKIEAAA